ncbi:FkbM family methyltransferase [candidate division KSB1 bacterium]|nr:FkbM family methyltransferase [candidate division KSB1 bacterium]
MILKTILGTEKSVIDSYTSSSFCVLKNLTMSEFKSMNSVNKLKRRLRKLLSRLQPNNSAPVEDWQKREMIAEVAKEFNKDFPNEPLILLDVGASGACHSHWQSLLEKDLIHIIAVDMADDWSIEKAYQPTNLIKIKAALGDQNTERTAYITRHPACSSLLGPNLEVLESYPVKKWFEIMREEKIKIRRYDNLVLEKSLPQPDIAKIDVQGFEAQVLTGMGTILDNISCVEFECQLKKIYKNQSVFSDLYDFIIERDLFSGI